MAPARAERGVPVSAIAVAESIVEAPLTAAFARFIDYSYWNAWLPVSMRPMSGPSRALREGDKLKVTLGNRPLALPAELRVVRVRTDREICWQANLPGLLRAEHSYFFSNADGQTRIRSEELFAGLLTLGPLAKLIESQATEHAVQAIAGFARHMASLR